jgi:CSLREA domain-containing protein
MLFALTLPGAAHAQEVGHIAGNPLDVYADGLGRLQFRFAGQADGVFYSPSSNTAHAGLEIRDPESYYATGTATPLEGPTVQNLGSGKRALHSVYAFGQKLRVTEDVTYTDQTSFVQLRYAITNVSGQALTFRALEAADLYAAGSDDGTGVLELGPPRFVGGRSENGALTGLVEQTPWSHYQSGYYDDVFDNFAIAGLNDKIDETEQDNGVGAQWDFVDVGAGETRTIDVMWRLGAATENVRVTTTADSGDGACTAAECTLREAVAFAPRGTVIDIPAGTYALDPQLGELRLSGAMLRGAGIGATILSGAGQSRVLTSLGGQSFVSQMTLTGGNGQGESLSGSGGAIYVDSDSTLTLADVAVTDNRARGEGGGIYSDGVLKVARSVIARNVSSPVEAIAAGGGLALRGGTAELTNTTISGNDAERGAGIVSEVSVRLDLLNTTIAFNTGGAGLDLTPLSGAARANDLVTARNTLIAGNDGGSCAGDTPGQSSHTLTDDASCALAGPGDRQNGDARLQPLASGVHALADGSQALDTGDNLPCPLSDQLGTSRPQNHVCDIGAYERPKAADPEPQSTAAPTPEVTQPPPPPPPPVTRLQDPLPPPVVGKTVNAAPKSGTVKIKLPGSKRYIELAEGQQIPVGTTVDTRKGRITLTSAADSKGATQTADFYQGLFRISQTRGAKPITTLKLVETLTGCPKARRASASAAKKKRPKSRKLWGSGKGRFRTTGQFSSATVRGTVWLTQDRCDRTLTKVRQGTVTVRDNVKRKTVVVRAGRSYTARAKRR